MNLVYKDGEESKVATVVGFLMASCRLSSLVASTPSAVRSAVGRPRWMEGGPAVEPTAAPEEVDDSDDADDDMDGGEGGSTGMRALWSKWWTKVRGFQGTKEGFGKNHEWLPACNHRRLIEPASIVELLGRSIRGSIAEAQITSCVFLEGPTMCIRILAKGVGLSLTTSIISVITEKASPNHG